MTSTLRYSHHSLVTSWRWPHFSPAEIASRATGEIYVEPAFLDWLEQLREEYRQPMRINSCCRTPDEQHKLPGHRNHGAHVAGFAADIGVSGAEARKLVDLACEIGALGIGISQAESTPRESRYIHLDIWPVRLAPVIWSY